MTARIIQVALRRRDGWTVATCDAIPGLYVASPNAQEVLDDIPEAIRILFKKQHNIDVRVIDADYLDDEPPRASMLSWVAFPQNALQPALAAAG